MSDVINLTNCLSRIRSFSSMATFKYLALNAQGQKEKGKIEANDVTSAISQLHGKSLNILNIKESNQSFNPIKKISEIARYTSPSVSQKANFLRQLAMMTRGGHTLTQALALSAEMSEKESLQKSIVDMLVRIQAGESFSGALEAQGRIFPAYVSKLLTTAERAGELPDTLERLADHMEQDADVRSQFRSSLIYPGILFLVALAVFLGLAINVVPKFATLLEGRSQKLPGISQAMLDISQWVIAYGAYLVIAIVLLIVAFTVLYRIGISKKLMDNILINTPVIGTNIRNSAMAQMGWSMSMLLGSGQTVLESLGFMSRITNNSNLSQSFDNARNSIIEGRSLSFGLRQPHIPLMVQHMSGVGEQSGELEGAMEGLGNHYKREAATRIKTMMGFLEPALILMVGGMVAFVYIGFFKAMMSVSSL